MAGGPNRLKRKEKGMRRETTDSADYTEIKSVRTKCAININNFLGAEKMKRVTFLIMAIMVFAPCVASGLVHSYAPMLSQGRFGLAVTTVGSKAIFAGGRTVGDALSDVVDIYDSRLGAPTNPAAWSTATLSQAREWLCAVTVGNKAIFAGGRLSGGEVSNRVDIYDASSGTWSTAFLSQARFALAATAVGSKALFAGGRGVYTNYSTVDIYDASSGIWSTITLSQARSWLAGITVDDKAVFAGGYDPYSNVVDIYDASLGGPTDPTAWSTANLSQARNGMAAVSLGNKGFFAGGTTNTTSYAVVDIYDASLGTWSTGYLSDARYNLAATTLGNIVIFGGGNDLSGSYSDRVDIYDCYTGIWTTDTFSQARSNLAAATVGDYAIFAGGYDGSNYSDVVDIYTIPEPAIEALVDINPDSLNKNSKGQWVTVYITLPAGYDVNKIDAGTIAITSLAGVSCQPDYHQAVDLSFVSQVGDRDEDAIADLTVKFNRQELIANLCLDDVAVTVEGKLVTGEKFKGIDHIRVIDRGK